MRSDAQTVVAGKSANGVGAKFRYGVVRFGEVVVLNFDPTPFAILFAFSVKNIEREFIFQTDSRSKYFPSQRLKIALNLSCKLAQTLPALQSLQQFCLNRRLALRQLQGFGVVGDVEFAVGQLALDGGLFFF